MGGRAKVCIIFGLLCQFKHSLLIIISRELTHFQVVWGNWSLFIPSCMNMYCICIVRCQEYITLKQRSVQLHIIEINIGVGGVHGNQGYSKISWG